MPDTKEGREKQAREAENRQREREMAEELDRSDEPEPEASEEPQLCHYRNCDEPATFRVVERYLEETGHGLVTAEAFMCRDHAGGESPANLDHASADYVFQVEPITDAFESQGSES